MLTGVRALIVESIAINRGILNLQMSGWGMTNRVAASPQEAIDLLAQAAARNAPYDIAIVDAGLREAEAFELARAIRAGKVGDKLRLVLLSRRAVESADARAVGIDACLAKPVRQSMLYECLVNVMAGQQQDAVRATRIAQPVTKAPARARGKILLVEDNLINQQVAHGILQMQGYHVTLANNGREALVAHEQGSFDLILMDCHMPEMDGFEATKEIRERERATGKRVPIIALTANAMAHDREECMNAGMDEHLSKPFSMATLRGMLDRWIPDEKASQAEAEAVSSSDAPRANGSTVLDREVLEQLGKVRTNGRPELLAKVINLYLSESPKLVQKLKHAAGNSDAIELARSAHSLKSSSANVGAKALSRYCADIEASARRADTHEACKLLAKLEAEHGSVQTALAAESEQLLGAINA
jgi:CheY-like chemotaxis protein